MRKFEGWPDWNPTFVIYAREHMRTPVEQAAQDKVDWPGGCMTGFILWVAQKKREFFAVCPDGCLGPDTIYDDERWARFLDTGRP
jgi:hypothetical protein